MCGLRFWLACEIIVRCIAEAQATAMDNKDNLLSRERKFYSSFGIVIKLLEK